jgi:hypothetical protein
MPLFDAYIFIDWNSKNTLGPQRQAPDNVWIGQWYSNELYPETYCRSRDECIDYLIDILKKLIRENQKVLIGFDFSYGYPKGLANALGHNIGPKPWCEIWEEISNRIKDTQFNENNRFEVANDLNAKIGGSGPFWGHPQGQTWGNLNPRSPGFPFRTANGEALRRLRIVDSRVGGLQETWQLFGAGSVGGQALVGIPRLKFLRKHKELSQYSKIWPFETGFTLEPSPKQGPFVLHAEIWPGIVKMETELIMEQELISIKDKAQVHAMCEWASRLDKNDELGEYFSTPRGFTESQIRDCIDHEGWILGVC